MHKHLLLGLLGLVSLSANSAAAQIVPVQENGRTVYVDVPRAQDQTAMAAPQYGPRKVYLYYSKSEHRWKRVPPASGATMRAARSAAKDVQQYILWRQQQPAFRVNFAESTPEAAAKPAFEPAASAVPSEKDQVGDAEALTVPSRKGLTAEQLDAIIDEAAAKHGVDSNLVRAVVKVESNFNPRAVSRKGAMGLMQLMPSTARSLQVTNPFDARQNVDGGVRHLKSLLENFNGDVTRSVAAYNAGAGAVTRNHGVPPFAETQAYVRRINQLYSGDTPMRRSTSAPIRAYRDKFGVLTFTND
ncbi:MAG: lytic transglycosylase domain-containing protein [Acidobacteriota bacterium]|nr:lytic transglycosylase domain-containing protein [Acidobacteriota bacterium]